MPDRSMRSRKLKKRTVFWEEKNIRCETKLTSGILCPSFLSFGLSFECLRISTTTQTSTVSFSGSKEPNLKIN